MFLVAEGGRGVKPVSRTGKKRVVLITYASCPCRTLKTKKIKLTAATIANGI
jgi:hypothetical protein